MCNTKQAACHKTRSKLHVHHLVVRVTHCLVLLTSTHAYSSQSSPRRSHPGSGYLRCTGKVISARILAVPSRPRSLFDMSTHKLKLTRCCPDTDDGSSTSIGSPSKVSTPTVRLVGSEGRTSKSCRVCCSRHKNIGGSGGHVDSSHGFVPRDQRRKNTRTQRPQAEAGVVGTRQERLCGTYTSCSKLIALSLPHAGRGVPYFA